MSFYFFSDRIIYTLHLSSSVSARTLEKTNTRRMSDQNSTDTTILRRRKLDKDSVYDPTAPISKTHRHMKHDIPRIEYTPLDSDTVPLPLSFSRVPSIVYMIYMYWFVMIARISGTLVHAKQRFVGDILERGDAAPHVLVTPATIERDTDPEPVLVRWIPERCKTLAINIKLWWLHHRWIAILTVLFLTTVAGYWIVYRSVLDTIEHKTIVSTTSIDNDTPVRTWWHAAQINDATYSDIGIERYGYIDVDQFLTVASTGEYKIDSIGTVDPNATVPTIFIRTDAMIAFLARHPRFPCFVELGCQNHFQLETFLRRFLPYTNIEIAPSIANQIVHSARHAMRDEYKDSTSATSTYDDHNDNSMIPPDVSLATTELARELLVHIAVAYGNSEYGGGCIDATSIGKRVGLAYTSNLGVIGDIVIHDGTSSSSSDDTMRLTPPFPTTEQTEFDRELGQYVSITRYKHVIFSAIAFDQYSNTWTRIVRQATTLESDALCLQRMAGYFAGRPPSVHRILFGNGIVPQIPTADGIKILASRRSSLLSFSRIEVYSLRSIASEL